MGNIRKRKAERCYRYDCNTLSEKRVLSEPLKVLQLNALLGPLKVLGGTLPEEL